MSSGTILVEVSMTVDELMTPDPAFLGPDDSVRDVIDLLFSLDVRHVPIVRQGELVGMISDRDVREATLPVLTAFENPDEARKIYDRLAGDLMRSDLVTVERQTPVSEVIDLMLDQKVGAVPVVETGGRELVGIVSYIDVLRVCRDLV